jgi:hypothetical protein
MSDARQFPVLLQPWERRDYPDCPKTVPWDLLKPHETQAYRNHGQSLATLASRGGLDPVEMIWVIEGQRWTPVADWKSERQVAIKKLNDRLREWSKGNS